MPPVLTKMEQLDLAIYISITGHFGTFDKGGKPYSLHPLHLMWQLMYDPQRAAMAVLHDWLEDVWITKEKLKTQSFQQILADGIEYLRQKGFSERLLVGLGLLTHDPDMPYELYIQNICGNLDAICVKRKDIHHNSDACRLKGVEDKDQARIVKYHKSYLKLGEAKKNFERK